MCHRQATARDPSCVVEPELRSYLSARFPETAAPEVVVDTVYGRTEGHPLFVANLIDDWTARGLLRPADERWGLPERGDELALGVPKRLGPLIEHRIDALSQAEQRLLAAAAAAGGSGARGCGARHGLRCGGRML
ncbi:MAG: hypothetical protein ACREYF_11270 [Gammaproteobacteria bacterium]